MTELILILRRRETQLTATNTEHKRFSLYPFLFSLSLPPFWISFKRVWEWGLTMGRQEGEPPLLLWDWNTLLITWHVKETYVPGFLALQTAGWAAAVTEVTWCEFWMPPACHLLSRQVWWTRLLSWGYFEGDCLFWGDVDGKKLPVCSSGNWPVVRHAKWQQDHHMCVPSGACSSGWGDVRAASPPDNKEGWRGVLHSIVAAAAQLWGFG